MAHSAGDFRLVTDYVEKFKDHPTLTYPDPPLAVSTLWGADSQSMSATEICKTIQSACSDKLDLQSAHAVAYAVVTALYPEPGLSGNTGSWPSCKKLDLGVLKDEDQNKAEGENGDEKKEK